MYSTKPHAFDVFLLIIPTRSNNPTAYLPRFSPLCAPDIALNPIISLRIFHFPSFTSIQWAVIPRNPIFVVSADHPSAVIDTLPGANYADVAELLVSVIYLVFNAYCDSLLHTLDMCDKLVMKVNFNIVRTRQIIRCGLGSHGDEGISEGSVIGECKGLWNSRFVINFRELWY